MGEDSGLLKKYGPFSPTDHRKLVVSSILKRFPNMRESITRQLKHSEKTDRIYYDLEVGRTNAVEVLERRKQMFPAATPAPSVTPAPPATPPPAATPPQQ